MLKYILALFLLIPAQVWGGVFVGFRQTASSPPVYVNSADTYGTSSTYTPAAVGNVLVLCAAGNNSFADATVTTSPSITFTAMTSYSGNGYARCYWGVAGSTSSHSVQLTGTTFSDTGYIIYEASGVNTSSPTDGENAAVTTNSTSFSSGSITTTGPALLIGFTSDRGSTSNITWDSGWTERQENLGHVHGGATNSQAAAGTFSASGTRPSTTTQLTIILALKGT